MKTFFVIALFAMIVTGSCKKQSGERADPLPGIHPLWSRYDRTVRITQAIAIYDSVPLGMDQDSSFHAVPNYNTRYAWKVEPNDGSVLINDLYHNDLAAFTFNRAGTYQVFALIYDSTGERLRGKTDTMQIQVLNDTLCRFRKIDADDRLVIYAGTPFQYVRPGPPSTIVLPLSCFTTNQYEYYDQLNMQDSVVDGDRLSIIFSDTIELPNYPYALRYGIKSTIGALQYLSGFTENVARPFSIVWLGKEYSGSITLHEDHTFTFDWPDNSVVTVYE